MKWPKEVIEKRAVSELWEYQQGTGTCKARKGMVRKIWEKPSVSPEKLRESVNLRRKISSVVKCCWQVKPNRHENMSIACNYMSSLVGSVGNMVNTSLNEVVGDEGRLQWVQEWLVVRKWRWWEVWLRKESSVTGGTWWSTAERMSWEGERGQALHPIGESASEGSALDGRWDNAPNTTRRMKENEQFIHSTNFHYCYVWC